MKKPWHEAATLIVVARDETENLTFDYKVLTFERSEKTSFLPNSICFPGGGIEKTDESRDWVQFLKQQKIPSEELERKMGLKKPFIFDPREENLKREISLRLTAIRETFEELGVGLFRGPSDETSSTFSSFYHTKDCDIPLWQKKVHSHDESMLDFCRKFNVAPDIMNIHEWCCWLTPSTLHVKRHETIFFLVALNSIPPVYPESHEVHEFAWKSPDELLQLHQQEKITMFPPQLVEITRLSRIKSIDKLVKIAKERRNQDMDIILPIQFTTNNGVLLVLPGDELYPENPNFHETGHDVDKFSDKSIEEMRSIAKTAFRTELNDMRYSKIYANVGPPDGHVSVEADPIAKL